MTKIVILGKNGQVGFELQRAVSFLGEIIALDRHSDFLCGDLNQLKKLSQSLHEISPDVIINAAAYNAVDKAESEPEKAFAVNALAPEQLAQDALALNALLIHYSTDYVFSGVGTRPWVETDPPSPLSIYGRSKLAGEEAIQRTGCKYLIFRTSWVYGFHGHNFLKTILKLSQEKPELKIVHDQVGVPTGADLLADVTAHCLLQALKNSTKLGLYHLVPQGETTWYDLAQVIVEKAWQQQEIAERPQLTPISTAAYGASAQRPLNSRLNTNKISNTFSIHLPHWKPGVLRTLTELME